ncbi:MAG: heavy-metal-associated domain-containing protein [Gemmataceae bacterium]
MIGRTARRTWGPTPVGGELNADEKGNDMAAKERFRIRGMDCAEEVAVLKREVGPLVGGGDQLAFDILNGTMTVLPGGPDVSAEQIAEAVARTGMTAEPWRERREGGEAEGFWRRRERTVFTALSGALTLAGLVTHAFFAGSFRDALGSEGLGDAAVPAAAKSLWPPSPSRPGCGSCC